VSNTQSFLMLWGFGGKMNKKNLYRCLGYQSFGNT
jgi:hypothetical protein